MSTPMGPEDLQHVAAEVGRLFGLYHEQVDRLMTERTQENERLRADLGRLDALQTEIARINHDNDRLRAERDELLAAFSRMADLVDQVRHSRGGGVTGSARERRRRAPRPLPGALGVGLREVFIKAKPVPRL